MYNSITSYDDDFTSTYIITVELAVKQAGKNGYSHLASKLKNTNQPVIPIVTIK